MMTDWMCAVIIISLAMPVPLGLLIIIGDALIHKKGSDKNELDS